MTSYLEVELENLCTRLASEANKWKSKFSHDSIQETTLVLADSFQDFRTADLKLQEVEPKVSTHAAVLDNWPLYCAQTHEKEQIARTQVHHLLIQLQQTPAEERTQVQLQIDEQQQQITELNKQAMQWIHEGKKAQTEI